MAYKDQILFALKNMDAYTGYHEDDLVRLPPDTPITSVRLSNSGGWGLSDIGHIAEALLTKSIDIAGHGCESCGYGAEIHVQNIPHPFPCIECAAQLGAATKIVFCCAACRVANSVRKGLKSTST